MITILSSYESLSATISAVSLARTAEEDRIKSGVSSFSSRTWAMSFASFSAAFLQGAFMVFKFFVFPARFTVPHQEERFHF